LQHPGVLLEKIALLRTCDSRPVHHAPHRSLGFAPHEFIQAGQPVWPACPRHGSHNPLKQSGRRDKGANEIRPGFYERPRCMRERMPQAAGLFFGHGPGRPPRLDVARQQAQDLAPGQIGVADAGIGIAVPASNDHHPPCLSRGLP
jgi:hypothetical protein